MEQLFGAIPDALGALGTNAEVNEAVVFAAWKRSAGTVLAERAIPREFFENRLIVAVEDEMWRRHLEELAPQMLAGINGFLNQGTVRFIEFRVEAGHSKAGRLADKDGSEEPAPVVPASVAKAAESIADLSLRTRFLESASGYLARQRADK